jgi:hypothetical protein
MQVIGERTRDAMQHLKAAGQVYSRPVCDDPHLLAWMQAQRVQGASYEAIARALEANDTPSTRGGRWSAMTVRRIVLRSQPQARRKVA